MTLKKFVEPLDQPAIIARVRADRSSDGTDKEWVSPSMRLVPLLIFWSLPFLPYGGHGQSLSGRDGMSHGRVDFVASIVIHQGTNDSIPGDPGPGSLGASFEDEEDTLEDGFVSACLSSCGDWHNAEQGNLSCMVHTRQGLLRIPSPPHPLRC